MIADICRILFVIPGKAYIRHNYSIYTLDAIKIQAIGKSILNKASFLELSLLRGTRRGKYREYWHYPHYGNQGGTPGASVRDGDWKLLEFFEDGRYELYNLAEDLSETTDLSKKHPEKVTELAEKLHAWEKRVMARRPVVNPDYEPWEDREPCGHFALDGDGNVVDVSDPRV